MEIKSPETEQEWNAYYDLRWRVLRAPWNQPRGSEKDNLEEKSIHQAAIEEEKIISVGRIHFNNAEEAQVRYMATEEKYRGKGIGEAVLKKLEEKAKESGAKSITLNAREKAVPFYERNGYIVEKDGETMFGKIKHKVMRKSLNQ